RLHQLLQRPRRAEMRRVPARVEVVPPRPMTPRTCLREPLMLHVHLRVNDSATPRPVPVRLRLLHAADRSCAPFGRLTAFAPTPGADVGGHLLHGGRAWSYIDGTCEVFLPPGQATIEIVCGPEYVPLARQVNVAAGQLSLRLALQRWIDPRPEG